MKIAALVPMRHHSQRVPGKNYRELAGKPLFHHIIETLHAVPEIDIIVVDTDSQIIMDGLAETFPEVRVIPRPKHLREDDRPMNDILLYDTNAVEADFYLQTHSTNPLLRSETVSAGIHAFLEAYPAHDSLFSVTRHQARFYARNGEAINHNPKELIQTQDLDPLYEENSCIYLFTREDLIKYNHRIGKTPLIFEIPALEAIDIDEESDFRIADILMKERNAQK
ncbi:MAG TPA: acylneuraminate cytidylyltransferase family protein [Anaerolineales bacterium]|nr:acylneuraminate cytidylyltransferase family protein [Anaerolineales bacterium]